MYAYIIRPAASVEGEKNAGEDGTYEWSDGPTLPVR